MAQSTQSTCIAGVHPYWETPSTVDAPVPWTIWRDRFRMALFTKADINLKTLLIHPFINVVAPTITGPPAAGETAAQRTTREATNNTEQDQYDTACKAALAAACGKYTREDAELKACSYLYMSLGEEGKRRLHQRIPDICPSEMFLCEFMQSLESIFHKERNVLLERVLFNSRRQGPNESMQDYFAALTELANRCDFGAATQTHIRDIFVTNIRDNELQRQLITRMTSPDNILKETITYEMGLHQQRSIKNALKPSHPPAAPKDADTSKTSTTDAKIKAEPTDVLAISKQPNNGNATANSKARRVGPNTTSRQTARPSTAATQSSSRTTGRPTKNVIPPTKKRICNRCGGAYSENHIQVCKAVRATCSFCGIKGHFQRVCRKAQRQNTPAHQKPVHHIYGDEDIEYVDPEYPHGWELEWVSGDEDHSSYDSSDDYSVLAIKQQHSPVCPRKTVNVLFPSGNCTPFLIDTGAVVSLITRETVVQMMGTTAVIRDLSAADRARPLCDFNAGEVRRLGKLCVDVDINGWHAPARFFVVDSGCDIVGIDTFEQFGFELRQRRQPQAPIRHIREITPNPPNSQGNSLKSIHTDSDAKQYFSWRYPELFTRTGRANHHTVRTKFIKGFTPTHQKGRRVPLAIQPQVEAEINRLQTEGHIIKLTSCTDDQLITPIVITVKRDKPVKLALDSRHLNKNIHKNKYQMPNIDELMDNVSQIITSKTSPNAKVRFTLLRLRTTPPGSANQPPMQL